RPCALSRSTPAGGHGGPAGRRSRRARRFDLPRRTLVQTASNGRVVPLAAPAVADAGPTASPAPRAVPAARAYPRGFNTYGALIDYAGSVAAAQRESDDRLVALMARQDTAIAALEAVFDPRLRGGLLRARADLMDDTTLNALQTEIADDAATGRQLVADGAVAVPAGQWRLPLLGEDTQDFGPTPYYFEPA